VLGDTVIMPCNATSSAGVIWTRNKTDGYFSIIYVNGSIVSHNGSLSLFSVVNTSAGAAYSLSIYNVQPDDSGFYDCYETDGRRIISYYLRVTYATEAGWLLFNCVN